MTETLLDIMTKTELEMRIKLYKHYKHLMKKEGMD